MEQAKFTPGPWRCVVIGVGGGWNDPVNVCEVRSEDGDRHVAEHIFEQDARLIAAAPDLLRVAELVVDWLDEEPGSHKLCDAARAAIAKALGEQQ